MPRPYSIKRDALSALGRRWQGRQASERETVHEDVRRAPASAGSCRQRRQAGGEAGLRPAKARAGQSA
jgi:hypothetical protein